MLCRSSALKLDILEGGTAEDAVCGDGGGEIHQQRGGLSASDSDLDLSVMFDLPGERLEDWRFLHRLAIADDALMADAKSIHLSLADARRRRKRAFDYRARPLS